MKNLKFLVLVLFLVSNLSIQVSAQCLDENTIYSFQIGTHNYELVKENRTWLDASVCAVAREGYLAEINDEEEQNAIFNELTNNADIDIANTQNQFGTASVWIGGTDSLTEGEWMWDGDNDGEGIPFWEGGSNGASVGGNYTNWGISPAEPDNSGGQDHLTIIIKPTAVNFGLWNDLVNTNELYYLIEYDMISANRNLDASEQITIYPNPFDGYIQVENRNLENVKSIAIFNQLGARLHQQQNFLSDEISLDLSTLNKGVYFIQLELDNGLLITKKIIK